MSNLLASTTLGTDDSPSQGKAVIATSDSVYLAGQTKVGLENQTFVSKYGSKFAHSKITKVQAKPNSFSSTPVYKGAGDTIKIGVLFDTYVKVDTTKGKPHLLLNATDSADQNIKAIYSTDNPSDNTPTKELIFEWTIANGDSTKGAILNCLDSTALKIGESTILPAADGTAADIDLTVPTTSSDLPNAQIHVSTVPATISAVSSTAKDGVYGPGAIIPITVSFSDQIKSVTGTPEILLNSGGKALYKGYNNTDKRTLIFEYQVGSGETAAKLDCASINALSLPNGATLVDNYGTTPILTLPAPGSTGSIGEKSNLQVASNSIIVEKATVAPEAENKTYKAGDAIKFDLTFNQAVTVENGGMEIALNPNKTDYYEILATAPDKSNSKTHTFTYTVQNGENIEKLDFTSSEALRLVGGAIIKAAAGNTPVSLVLPTPGSENSLAPAKITIDTTPPAFITTTPAKVPSSGNFFKNGDKIQLKVSSKDQLIIKENAKPYIVLDYKTSQDAEAEKMVYEGSEPYTTGGANGTTLIFAYTVTENDNRAKTSNLIKDWKVIAQAGEITDQAGNDLNPAMKAPSGMTSTWKIGFDNIAPAWPVDAELTAVLDKDSNNNPTKNVTLTRTKAATDINGSGIKSYTIYRQIKGSDKEPEEITTLNTSTKTYKNTTTEAATTYVYTIVAQDDAGNLSTPLSVEITTPGGTSKPDTEAPYWDNSKTLSAERQTAETVLLSWDPTKASDDQGKVVKFNIYAKTTEDWQFIDSIANTNTAEAMTMTLKNIILEQAYEFKVEAVDNSSEAGLESTDGPIASLAAEYPYLAIVDKDDKVIKNFIYKEIEPKITKARYSGLSKKDGNTYKTWYAANGVLISEILAMAGIEDYTSVDVLARDKMGQGLSKSAIESDAYCYPHNYNGTIVNREPVRPMIALWYTESQSITPNYAETPGDAAGAIVPRLFFGQADQQTENRNRFVKEVTYLRVYGTSQGGNEQDKVKPTIALNGDAKTFVKKGQSYTDLGVTATDAYGVALTGSAIETEIYLQDAPTTLLEAVDVNTPGTYIISYTATDKRGNSKSVQRQVVVYASTEPIGVYKVAVATTIEVGGQQVAAQYTVDQNAQVPTLVASNQTEAMIPFAATITPVKTHGTTQTVIAVQMRGNKMIDIASFVDGYQQAIKIAGQFTLQKEDKIMIFVVDHLSASKGEGTVILYE